MVREQGKRRAWEKGERERRGEEEKEEMGEDKKEKKKKREKLLSNNIFNLHKSGSDIKQTSVSNKIWSSLFRCK